MKPDPLLVFRAAEVFTPAAPIDRKALFAGRTKQLRRVVDVVHQRGQHAIIYGERGVGKTSLARVLGDILQTSKHLLTAHVNCDTGDDYSSLWRKIFRQIEVQTEIRSAGFDSGIRAATTTVADQLPRDIETDDVRRWLALLASRSRLVLLILDEFDRLREPSLRSLFADTIKLMSDQALPVTLVLVGVADTVDELLEEHESVERAPVQIPVPRMSRQELAEIIDQGLEQLGMTIEPESSERITLLSRGLPHYTHLLALHSARNALDDESLEIRAPHTAAAISQGLEDAQQSVKSTYHRAVSSPRKDSLYVQVLLACALAKTDERGFFAPADVRAPLSKIMGKRYDIPRFMRHLNEFSQEQRGRVLERSGAPRKYRYRFSNPLMQPFVTLHGFANGLLREGVD